MNIYQILPNKSVRHGLVEMISMFPDICAIEFGPEGTMHYLSGAMAEASDNVFTSGLREKNVIFGTTDLIEQAVLDLLARKHPICLFLIASCVTEIIGTDLGAVARRLSKQTGAKIIAVDNLQLDMDYADGYRLFYKLLVRHVLPELTQSQASGYTILGLSPTDYHGKADFRELKRMFSQYLGLSCRNGPGGSVSMETLTNCRFHLVLRQEALPLAEAIREQFGIPYLLACPYGISQTNALLEAASAYADRDFRTSLVYQEELALAEQARRIVMGEFRSLENFSLVLHGDLDRIAALSRCFREECRLENQIAVCAHHTPSLPEGILPRPSEKEFITLMEQRRPNLLLSNEIYCRYFRSLSLGFPLFGPVSHLRDFDEFSPYLGLRGWIHLAQSLTNTLECGLS